MAGKQASPPPTNIAVVDIPPPYAAENQGIVAFRAGDEIPQTWLDEHADYVKGLEEQTGGGASSVVRRASLAEAQQIAADARSAGSPQP